MAKKLLVVVPTEGTALDTQRIAGALANTAKTTAALGLKPVFLIVATAESRKAVANALRGAGHEFHVIARTEPGFGSAVLEGIRKGLRAEKPDYVMTMFADYQMESRHLGGVIKPLASGAADFVSSAWKHGHATALEYPLPQYLNETRVSAAVTYANPHFKPRNLNPYAAVPQALGEGRAFQVFSGVFGFPAKAWPVLEKQLAAFGSASGHVNSWGLEPALMLSALNARLRVSNAFFSRGYEHPFPTDRKKFVRSRLQQFDSGMAVVKHFLAATGQREKLSALEPVISQERKRIENSPLKRPFHERLVKEFRPTFLYRK